MAIMVGETSEGVYACSDYFEWLARQNGKGALLEARALGGLFCYDEPLIGWSAHRYDTAMEANKRVKALIRNIGAVDYKDPNLVHVQLPGWDYVSRVKFHNSHGEEEVERLDTGQRLKFFARSKGAARGFSAPIWLLDETFALVDEELDAISPTQLTFWNSQTVFTSTPPLSGDTSEPMYNIRERAERGDDDELGGRDWGLRRPDGRPWDLEDIDGAAGVDGWAPIDVDDPELWSRTNPEYGGRIRDRAMRKDRRARGRVGFARETLCIWPRRIVADVDAIDMDMWNSRGDADSAIHGRMLVLAVDVSPNQKSAAVASAGKREDGRMHVRLVQYRAGTSWVIPYLKELIKRTNPRAIMINSAGPAGAIREDMIAANIKKIEDVNGIVWARACAAFLKDVQEDKMRHCEQTQLNSAIECATRKYFGDAVWYWYRKDSTGDIAPLAAVTAAAHGFRVYGRSRFDRTGDIGGSEAAAAADSVA